MNEDRHMSDEDLEIPEIDSFPGKRRRTKEDSLETTGADGIPFFLKGEDPQRKNTEKAAEEFPSFLAGSSENEEEEEPAAEKYDSHEPEDKKESPVLKVILGIILFIILTAALLFAGITIVNNFVQHPQDAPIMTAAPAETSMPSAEPSASAAPAE